MPDNNPYEDLSPERQLEIENEKKAIETKQLNVAKLAAECLADPKFMKYADEFKGLRKQVFEKLREPMDSDPIKDAHYLRGCINTILVLDILIEGPQKDLKREGL